MVEESIIRHPHVLTSTEIHKRLGINYKSARLLKQRFQLFASDQMPAVKKLIYKELANRFKDVHLPRGEEADYSEFTKKYDIPQADSIVLFSASQRANKGRKRFKHTGQTASIYLSEKLGGKQVGTMVHTLGWRNGPVIYDSIPDNTAETIKPLLDEYLPKHTPLYTDEGYKWYYRLNQNHRMVNHSAKAKRKTNRRAKNRWCKNGVHNQVSEGLGRAVKDAFRSYCWFAPEYGQLYLNEFSFLKSVKYFGLEKISQKSEKNAKKSPVGTLANKYPSARAAAGVPGIPPTYSKAKNAAGNSFSKDGGDKVGLGEAATDSASIPQTYSEGQTTASNLFSNHPNHGGARPGSEHPQKNGLALVRSPNSSARTTVPSPNWLKTQIEKTKIKPANLWGVLYWLLVRLTWVNRTNS